MDNTALILVTKNSNTYFAKRLSEESDKLGVKICCLNPFDTDISFGLSRNSLEGNGRNISNKKFSCILHRVTGVQNDNFDLLFSQYLEKTYRCELVNPYRALRSGRDKGNMAFHFFRHGIPQIPTYLYRGKFSEESYQKMISCFKGFHYKDKYVVKLCTGNQGIGVNLVNGKNSLFSFLETFWAIKDQKLLIQPFVETKQEYRFFIVNNSIWGILVRSPGEGQFKANYFQGGEGKLIKESELPLSIKNLALKTHTSLGCFYSTVEIIIFKGRPFVIEINTLPGIKQIETIMQENLAKKLLLELLERKECTS